MKRCIENSNFHAVLYLKGVKFIQLQTIYSLKYSGGVRIKIAKIICIVSPKKKPLEDEPLKLCIPNFSENVEHVYNCKRPLRGEQRKAIGKELQNTEGYLMQKELVLWHLEIKYLHTFILLKF